MKLSMTSRNSRYYEKSKDFMKFCDDHGIRRKLSTPYSPQQNGVVERRNYIVMDTVRSIVKTKNLLQVIWGEAINTMIYLS